MCQMCGCSLPGTEHVVHGTSSHPHQSGHEHLEVLTHLLAVNDEAAAHNRSHLDMHGVLAINFMSSPGAGKTSLLEATIRRLRSQYRISVVEGDLATENDAQRIRAQGVPAIQITTGNACHLDASMLHGALHDIALADVDLLFIENVGNLVCPASFDLGQHRDVVLLSVPEGDDKPEKYPVMFRAADLVLITKAELLEHIPEFDLQRARGSLQKIASAVPVLELSARRETGMDAWIDWLHAQKLANDSRIAAREPVIHQHAHAIGAAAEVRAGAD